eukprot:GFYU01004640.1.p1 GENE.GFYU01004640.1~~GFYU01004640.1.p1  ORF type:complete len:938 (-),score=267.55 GFYU01004640.1:157-2970(-)
MAMFQWRKFPFFDTELVKEQGTNQPHTLFQKLNVTCCASGRGSLIFGDTEGYLNIVDHDFEIAQFQAYEGSVSLLTQLRNESYLIAIGNDSAEQLSATIKLFRLDKLDKNGNPTCLRSMRIFSPKAVEVPVLCMSVVEDMSHMAIGLDNGAILLYRGDLVNERNIKPRILQPEGLTKATGLFFRDSMPASLSVYAATTNNIQSHILSRKGDAKMVVLEEIGAAPNCSVLSDDLELVVGRDEAVYFYPPEDKGPCYAFEGVKKLMAWFRNYLIVVFEDKKRPNSKKNTLSIYDLKNKFLAYSQSFDGVQHIVAEWGSVFVLCEDKKIYQLTEKDTQTKLETLFRRNLYQVAINLGIGQQADIYRKYGDHLYGKGDYDGAISQYINTIGRLEPSYVIRKFLDAQRIHNLTKYLEALHEDQSEEGSTERTIQATKEHTTLLLNCYTKLKDVAKLDQFIKTDSLHFEKETAIRVCRQAGYYEHALFLALKEGEHDWYLKIQLEDMHDYQSALSYISTQGFYEAECNLEKHGKVLMASLPDQTTALLKKLCTHYVPKVPDKKTGGGNRGHAEIAAPSAGSAGSTAAGGAPVKASPENFIHIFVGQPRWLTDFLEYMQSEEPNQPPVISNTLLELYLRDDDLANDPQKETKVRDRRDKALALLRNEHSNYDPDHALLLCQLHEFKPGLLCLYQKLKLYQHILELHMESRDPDAVLKICKRDGDKDPNLWVQALTYFVKLDGDWEREIRDILSSIERENLLSPLLVIQLLSEDPNIKLGVVKDYISRRLQHENQLIAEDQRQITKYREDTQKMRDEIEELQSSAKIFQKNKCEACSQPLELPSVHFLCMHSFHQRCLGDNESECVACAQQNSSILEIKRSLENSAGQHEQFFRQLDGATDGFSTVAEYFGRGVFVHKEETARENSMSNASNPPPLANASEIWGM